MPVADEGGGVVGWWSRRRAERVARALEDPEFTPDDPATAAEVDAADALTPGLAPRESWRSELKERMLNEARRVRQPSSPDAGTKDGAYGGIHSVNVAAGPSAEAILADVEAIDEQRARVVAEQLARIARTFASEGQTRGPE